MKTIDYNSIAVNYDERYKGAYRPEGIAAKLLSLVEEVKAEKVLEVACGTGHWLEIIHDKANAFGIDLSFGMLKKAVDRKRKYHLVNGNITALPFSAHSFSLIYCVNAIHHFQNPSRFINNVQKLLKQTGALTVVGMDPHAGRDRWFIYDYFPGTYETDLKRYPSAGTIRDWMISSGFKNISCQIGERLKADRHGKTVLPLSQNFTSQLTLLSSKEFEKGIRRIESELLEAENTGKKLVFPVDISLSMVTGRLV